MTVSAIFITTSTNDITGAAQPLQQLDETANIVVAPALATAHNKQINIRMASKTECPYESQTNLSEFEILRPEDTKQMRPIDTAALKNLDNPDDSQTYVHGLMEAKENYQN